MMNPEDALFASSDFFVLAYNEQIWQPFVVDYG